MKWLNFLVLMVSSPLFGVAAFAGQEGGGGAQIEGAFHLRAYDLINNIAISPKADALCPADLMRTSLRATKVRIVDELLDPSDGKPLTTQNLDAWTIPGDMQLLKASWEKFLDPSISQPEKSVDVLILHETYRSTGGSCDDDDFKISDQIPSLLTGPTKYSQVFALTGPQDPDFSNHDTTKSHSTYCNGAPTDGVSIICGILYPIGPSRSEYEFDIIQGYPSGLGGQNRPVVREHLAIAMKPLTSAEFQQISNLLAFASLANPFFAVFDIHSGSWSYGFDLADLIKLQ